MLVAKLQLQNVADELYTVTRDGYHFWRQRVKNFHRIFFINPQTFNYQFRLQLLSRAMKTKK